MHSSQGLLGTPIRKFLELFATRLTGLQGANLHTAEGRLGNLTKPRVPSVLKLCALKWQLAANCQQHLADLPQHAADTATSLANRTKQVIGRPQDWPPGRTLRACDPAIERFSSESMAAVPPRASVARLGCCESGSVTGFRMPACTNVAARTTAAFESRQGRKARNVGQPAQRLGHTFLGRPTRQLAQLAAFHRLPAAFSLRE
jgi:hypothetical protein